MRKTECINIILRVYFFPANKKNNTLLLSTQKNITKHDIPGKKGNRSLLPISRPSPPTPGVPKGESLWNVEEEIDEVEEAVE